MNTTEAPNETQAMVVRDASTPVQQPTPQEAKNTAIANLTFKAYERASTLDLTTEEVQALEKAFPDEAFKLGAGGNPDLIYIEHAYLRDRLNQVFRPGQWSIIPRNRWAEDFKTAKGDDASRVYVEAMLVVRGCFVSEAVGDMVYYKSNATQNYGDAVEGAKSACLRRCAKELGIGLQAWKKDFCQGWKQRNNGKGPSQRPTPQSATSGQSKPQNAPQRQPEGKEQPLSGEITTENVMFDDYKVIHSKPGAAKPWSLFVCTFSTDSGSTMECCTFNGEFKDKLDVLKGNEVNIAYKAGRKANTLELVSIEPADDLPM